MTCLVVADAADGRILFQIRTDTSLEEITTNWPLEGKVVAEVPAPLGQQEHWRVVDGACVARAVPDPLVSTDTIAADGVDEVVISGLPDPCSVQVRGAVSAPWTTVTGGSVTLTSSAAGEIRIDARAEPTHRPWSTTIHAV